MSADAVLVAREREALMKLLDGDSHGGNFAVPARSVDVNMIIATWNIQHFSNRHTTRALQYMADIIERFDIVALQEVKTDLRGLGRLQKLLPGNYRILVSDPTGNSERFAFLYDKRTVIPTGLASEIGFNVTAETHSGYQLHRMPYCASFRAGRFDFVIATAHIYFGKTKRQRAEREKEIARLADFIARRARTDKAKVFDRDFFVVGDFNIEERGDRFFEALAKEGFVMPENHARLGTNFARTRTYDKIAWTDRPSFSFSDKMNIVPFGKVLFRDGGPQAARKKISDHLPLWAEFRINELTQELSQIINRGQAGRGP